MNLLTIALCFIGVATVAASPSGYNNDPLQVNHGNCNYNNGYITENGQTRAATRREKELIEDYQRKVDDQTRGNTRSVQIKVPCLCSPAICQNNNVNIISGGQTDTRRTPYNNQNNQEYRNPETDRVENDQRPYENDRSQPAQDQSRQNYNPSSAGQGYQNNRQTTDRLAQRNQERAYPGPQSGFENPNGRTQERFDTQRNNGYPTRNPYAYSNAGSPQDSNIQYSIGGQNNVNSISK